MGKITDEQKRIIEKFSCERLSSKPENKELIKSFVSEKGRLLVDYLHNLAWDEDVECKTAYYLIKSPENEIALFFSLKCGALFDPLDEESVEESAKRLQKLLRAVLMMYAIPSRSILWRHLFVMSGCVPSAPCSWIGVTMGMNMYMTFTAVGYMTPYILTRFRRIV